MRGKQIMEMLPVGVLRIPRLVAKYTTAQRERFAPQSVPLSAAQRTAMSGFFQPEVLDAARVAVADGFRLENPPF